MIEWFNTLIGFYNTDVDDEISFINDRNSSTFNVMRAGINLLLKASIKIRINCEIV